MSSINHFESNTLPELLSLRSQIDARVSVLCGGDSAVVAASSATGAKPKKPSARTGKPTAYGAFSSKIQKENAEEIKAFKEANPEMKGAHMAWVGKYKEEHPDIYEAFKSEWVAANPKPEAPASGASSEEHAPADTKPKKVLSPEHLAKLKAGREAKKAAKDLEKAADEAMAKAELPISLLPPATPEEKPANPVKSKKPKQAKKAVAPVAPVAAVEEAKDAEQLPFKLGGATYIRMGISKPDGNHEWLSGDLWLSKKGVRGSYEGELMHDGNINKEAEEPIVK